MTQTVFDNAMVAHVWAQQRQTEGRSNNGNLYFHGPRIYSYGGHFLAGLALKPGGPFLVNADSYSLTTAKHMSYVRRAVSGEWYSLPSLTGIADSISRLYRGGGDVPAHHAESVRQYLDSTWAELSDGAGAFLYGLVSRGDWQAFKARAQAKADKAAAKAEAATARLHREAAARFAEMPVSILRARMAEIAARAPSYAAESWIESQLGDFVTELYHAHRNAGGKHIRAAVWERLKLAREIKRRMVDSPAERREAAKALAGLRRLKGGDVGNNGLEGARLALALASYERDRLLTVLSACHIPPALRTAWEGRTATLAGEIAELERQREAERMAEQAAERAAWLANAPDAPRFARHLRDERGGVLIRAEGAEIDGCTVRAGELVTSEGARVPLAHAVRVFAFVRHVREAGTGWNMTGQSKRTIRVGHFHVDRIEPSGDFVAGCHRINWNETERLARELGLWDCPATALAPEPEGEAA